MLSSIQFALSLISQLNEIVLRNESEGLTIKGCIIVGNGYLLPRKCPRYGFLNFTPWLLGHHSVDRISSVIYVSSVDYIPRFNGLLSFNQSMSKRQLCLRVE